MILIKDVLIESGQPFNQLGSKGNKPHTYQFDLEGVNVKSSIPITLNYNDKDVIGYAVFSKKDETGIYMDIHLSVDASLESKLFVQDYFALPRIAYEVPDHVSGEIIKQCHITDLAICNNTIRKDKPLRKYLK